MVKQINKPIFYYKPCKFFIDASAANLYKSLAYSHESHYIDYVRLKGKELEDVLYFQDMEDADHRLLYQYHLTKNMGI